MNVPDPYPAFIPGMDIARIMLGCAAIVVDEGGRVLLQRRADNGHWGLPGGGVDPGEMVADTVVREVFEETGYRVEVVRLHGVYSDPRIGQLIRYEDGQVVHIVALVFVCRVVGGERTVSHESTAVEWFDPRALPEPMTPSHVVRLGDFLSGSGGLVVR
jgi:ADP-ribose pyrophosphatase YjhB (NUDIX family)